jgi:sugar phosphate isomerase/epimerase
VTSAGVGQIRVGLCLAAYGGMSLRAALADVTEYAPLSVDLPTDTSLGLVDARRCYSDARYQDEVASLLAPLVARGVSVACVSNSRDAQLLLGPHGPHTDPVFPGSDEDKRQHAVRCSLGAVRLAQRIGAPVVRLLVGCPDFARWLSWRGSEVSWQDNIDQLFTNAEPVLKVASEAGVVVALEPHPKQVVYDRASAELLFAADHAWDDTLALCVDPANLAALGHDPVDSVRHWGARLVAVHAKDLQIWTSRGAPRGPGWCRYGPGPPIRFRALGLGSIDWAAVISALIDEEFDQVLYVEHEDELLPRRQSVQRSLGLLREMLPSGPAEGRTW